MTVFTSKDYPEYTSDGKYKVIGTRPIRHDGVDKVTGAAMYGADVRLPGLLFGKVLRSPHPHAKILPPPTTWSKSSTNSPISARPPSISARSPKTRWPPTRSSTPATPSPPSAPPARISPRRPST